jgi:hypothetical protein
MSYQYGQYLNQHKTNVKKGFDWIRDNLPELIKGGFDYEWQMGLNHDYSKAPKRCHADIIKEYLIDNLKGVEKKMIRIDVQDYCQACLDFEPDVEKPKKIYFGNGVIDQTDTVVRCKYRKHCEGIKRYLEYGGNKKNDPN